jgi:prepilin-type N-terminal cleavage/methylation domain-containing protein
MTHKRLQSGFTLIELLVSMVITVVLLGVLVYMTGISMDTYKKSRNEVRASRQSKEALETIAKDFESMILRRDGNTYEWLYAGQEPSTGSLGGPTNNKITNSSQLIFFTGATDRYNGDIGGTLDAGGDVSAVGYRLVYKDQISVNDDYPVFSLYRHLVNPDVAFENCLAEDDLVATGEFNDTKDLTAQNFLVENVYEFTVTFLVEYTTSGSSVTNIKRVTLSKEGDYQEFRVKGNQIQAGGSGLQADGSDAEQDLLNGSILGVEVSITVLTDHGLVLAQRLSKVLWEKQMKKHSYHYTKTINTPRP